jgi:CBS domain-containing protein
MTIKNIMQKELMTVTKTDTIEDVLKIMTEKKINGLPIQK